MNVDDVRQIIFRANNSNRNIREVYRGGDPPTLLWPKNYKYVIVTTSVNIQYHAGGGVVHPWGTVSDITNYASVTADIEVYTQNDVRRPELDIHDAVLTPISIGEGNTYEEDGETKNIFYIGGAGNQYIYANNLGTYTISNTDIAVTFGYRTAEPITAFITAGANVPGTPVAVTETTELEIRYHPDQSHDTVPAGGSNYEFQIFHIYDEYQKVTWTSGASLYYAGDTNQEEALLATEFKFDDNTTGFRWNSDRKSVIVTFANNKTTSQISHTLYASFTGTNKEGESVIVEDEVLIRQAAGGFSYATISVTGFDYSYSNISQQWHIPASGNTGSGTTPIYPSTIEFIQWFGWNGNTNTYKFDTTQGVTWSGNNRVTVIARDSSNNIVYDENENPITRTYILVYLNTTDENTGAVRYPSKGKNVDNTDAYYTKVGTVGLRVCDPDDISKDGYSGSIDIRQQANKMTTTTIRDWYISNYKLFLMHNNSEVINSDSSDSLSINALSYSAVVKSQIEKSKDVRYSWTSGATPENETISEDTPQSIINCSTFTVSGSSAYSKSGSSITFNENLDLTSTRSFTITDSTSYTGFAPTINVVQAKATYVYDVPIITAFRYDSIIPINGNMNNPIYPTLLEFTQARYINRIIDDSNHRRGSIGKSVSGGVRSGTADDGVSRFTIGYDGTNGTSALYGGVEKGKCTTVGQQNQTISYTVYATVTCNGKTSNPPYSTSVKQYLDYITNIRFEFESYTIEWEERNPEISPTGGELTVLGRKVINKYTTYASDTSNPVKDSDIDTAKTYPANLSWNTSSSHDFFDIVYNNTNGKLIFTPKSNYRGNQSLNDIIYNVTGTDTYTNNAGTSPYTKTLSSANSIQLTVQRGYYKYSNVTIKNAIVYDTIRVEIDHDDCHIKAGGGYTDPSFTYEQTYGWIDVDSGVGTISSGLNVSFSWTKVDSRSTTTLNTSTGRIEAASLGLVWGSSRTILGNSVIVTVTSTYNNSQATSTFSGNIYQEQNERRMMSADNPVIWIGNTAISNPYQLANYYSAGEQKSVEIIPKVDVRYGYTAYDYDTDTSGHYSTDTIIRTNMGGNFIHSVRVADTERRWNSQTQRYEDVIIGYHDEDQVYTPDWVSHSVISNKWYLNVKENYGAIKNNNNAVRFKLDYSGPNNINKSSEYKFGQAAAVWVLSRQNSSNIISITDTDTSFSDTVTSTVNGHAFAIDSNMISFNNNNINGSFDSTTSTPTTGLYVINFNCDYNLLSSSRSSTFTITQKITKDGVQYTGNSVSANVVQAAFTYPVIKINGTEATTAVMVGLDHVTVTCETYGWSYSCSTFAYNSTDGSGSYITPNEVSLQRVGNELYITRNNLSSNHVGHITITSGAKNDQHSYAYILVVPAYSITMSETNKTIDYHINDSIASATSTYPNNVTSVDSGGTGWLSWNNMTVKATENTSSNTRTGTATIRGTVTIPPTNSHWPPYYNTNTASIEVTQTGAPSYSIEVEWDTGDKTLYYNPNEPIDQQDMPSSININASHPWSCTYDSTYVSVQPSSGSTANTSVNVTINDSIRNNGNDPVSTTIEFYLNQSSSTRDSVTIEPK